MAKNETETTPAKFSVDDLKVIVAAGMAVSEARALLQEGYSPADVLELAKLQAEREKAAAAAAQTATAQAMHKVANRSNDNHPAISAFSYPEGDVARPKPELPFQFFYNAYPFHKFPETQHFRELELAAQVKPGTYTVLRKDASKMSVKVSGTTDADGNLEKVEVIFPVTRDEKALVPPQSVVLYQIVNSHKTPKRAFLEAMQEWLVFQLGTEDEIAATVTV